MTTTTERRPIIVRKTGHTWTWRCDGCWVGLNLTSQRSALAEAQEHLREGHWRASGDPVSTAALVRAFRTACGLSVGDRPRLIPQHRVDLHADLLAEEAAEYDHASAQEGPAHIARELADVVIVAYGAALDHGIDLDPVIAEVMSANMRKVVDGKVVMRDDGKILKPPGWTGPDVAGVLARQGVMRGSSAVDTAIEKCRTAPSHGRLLVAGVAAGCTVFVEAWREARRQRKDRA